MTPYASGSVSTVSSATWEPGPAGAPTGVSDVSPGVSTASPANAPRARTRCDSSTIPGLLDAKLLEEAAELVEPGADVAAEAADLLYFALVKSVAAGISLEDIERILDRRERAVTRRPMSAEESRVSELLRRLTPAQLNGNRPTSAGSDESKVAADIVESVRNGGEESLRAHAEEFGDIEPGRPLTVDRPDLRAAFEDLEPGHVVSSWSGCTAGSRSSPRHRERACPI